MTTNGRRRRIKHDEVVLRRSELDRITQTLGQVQAYLERLGADDAEDLLQLVEFTAFKCRRLGETPGSESVREE